MTEQPSKNELDPLPDTAIVYRALLHINITSLANFWR